MKKRSFLWSICLIFAVIFTGCTSSVPELTELTAESPAWHMGFGEAVISHDGLEGPFYIAGYRGGREITGVYDEMRASAVWMDLGGEGILLIGVDCIGLGSDWVERIRTALSPFCLETGCVSVNVYATHTHAGIDTLGLWGEVAMDGKNPAFMERVVEASVTAASLAYEDVRAGTLTYSYGETEQQKDSREPYVYDSRIHQLAFTPDDGTPGIRLVNYAAHAEALRGDNTCLSRDFPGLMSDLLRETTGERMLYLPGAIGGLIMTKELPSAAGVSSADELLLKAERTAQYLLEDLERAEYERELTPSLAVARVPFEIPMDNTLYLYYRFLGILGNETVKGESETGYSLATELSVMKLGEVTLALIPGELFPELVTGEYLDEHSSRPPANPEMENPAPLSSIAAEYGAENLLILGLANDEIGYIIPPNDFAVHPQTPYLTDAGDIHGENHYEETNSVGIEAAAQVAQAFREAMELLF